MSFAIKAEIRDPQAEMFTFIAQKTMYGGKHIAEGDTVFLFASENEGGQGLISRGIVTSSEEIAKRRGTARPTRVSVSPSSAFRLRSGRWGGGNLNPSPSGMTVSRRQSSISSSTAKQRTRSSVSRMKPRRSSADSSSPARCSCCKLAP